MFGFLRRLLRPRVREWPEDTELVLAAMRAAMRPTLAFVEGRGSTGLRLGGLPRMQPPIPWPRRDGAPLSLIAEMDLAKVRKAGAPDWLPSEGFLHFFYDADQQPWGFDPNDQGGWLVSWSAAVAGHPIGPPKDLEPVLIFDERRLVARPARSYPQPERLKLRTDYDYNAVETLLFEETGTSVPDHRVGGYPSPVQNDDMELECELVTNGINLGKPEAYSSPRAKALAAGADDWRLLLQVDSDDATGMMWGDSGMLYFWIREQDARSGDFSRVWLILQCC